MLVSQKYEENRQTIADRLLLVGTLVSIPAAILSGYRVFTMGVRALFILDFLVAIILILVYLTRSKTKYQTRLIFLLSYVFLLGFVSLNTFGLFGFGIFIMFFAIIITTVFFGLRYGLTLLGVATFILSAYALVIHKGVVNFSFDFNALSYSSFHWFSRTIFFLAFASMAVVTLGMINRSLIKINDDLSLSEERLNMAIESSNEAIWEVNLENNTWYISDQFFDLFKLSKGDLLLNLEGYLKIVHADDKVKFKETATDHLKGFADSIYVEYRIVNSFAETRWVLTKGKIVKKSKNGRPLRIVGTHTDISHRKQMEQILLESEQQFRMLFMSANDAILLLEDDIIVEVNNKAIDLFKLSKEQLIGQSIYSICQFQQSDGKYSEVDLKYFIEQPQMNLYWSKEGVIRNSENKVIDVHLGINKLTLREKTIHQIVLNDISQRKQFERIRINTIFETEERERLKLASDLHDDVGPLLSSLNMYLSLVKKQQPDKSTEVVNNMQEIVTAAIKSIREISTNISPHILNNYGLVSAINSIMEPNKNFIDITLNENLGATRLPKTIEIACYRIVKEMLNNTLKHAQASSVSINIIAKDELLNLNYADNGIGFDINAKFSDNKTGIGLPSILNRMETLKATYKIFSACGKGFNFEMSIKLND